MSRLIDADDLIKMLEEGVWNDVVEVVREQPTVCEASAKWIPVEERLPENNNYILLSFENFSVPMIGRYEENENGGAFYLGDCNKEDTCSSNDLFVNAWMPLPEPFCRSQQNRKCDRNCEACQLEDTDECTGM